MCQMGHKLGGGEQHEKREAQKQMLIHTLSKERVLHQVTWILLYSY